MELEAIGRRHESTLDERSPPLRVMVTGYRLMNTGVVLGFSMGKAILTYQNKSNSPNTLDLIGATFLGVM